MRWVEISLENAFNSARQMMYVQIMNIAWQYTFKMTNIHGQDEKGKFNK